MEEIQMSIQRLHAFEKTSIQARHSIKRLEMLCDTARTDDEVRIAKELLGHFNAIRKSIPESYQDVDIKERNEKG